MTEHLRTPPSPGRVAAAGAVAVVGALAVSELLAAVIGGVPSLIVAIGAAVIERVPGPVERFAIAMFGLADKLALNVGIVVVAMGIGAGAALLERVWRGVLRATFVAFAGLGWFAALGVPGTGPFRTGAVAAVVAAAGVWLHGRLTGIASVPADRTGVAADEDRRRFLVWVTGVVATAVIGLAVGRMLIQNAGGRSAAEVELPEPAEPVAAPPPEAAFSEVEGLTPVVVPNDDFFRIDTRLTVPGLDPDSWRLRITGMVDREVELTYDDILEMALVERYVTIACVSNEVGGGLVGNAAWSGVPLADVLGMAGVQDGATQVVGRAFDGWTAGFPTEAAFDGRGSLLAVGMNGEPLPPAHGFPARLIVPGLYGYVSATKWLTEIELTTWEDFDAYWVPRGWAKEGPVKLQSRIDVPRGGRVEAGQQPIAGVAWAPNVGVAEVEVRIDEGEWRPAELSEPLSDDAWRQWRLTWDATPGRHTIEVRATDATGMTQPRTRQRPFPDGATGWHTVDVTVG